MNITDEILKQLAAPFSEKQISWRVGAKSSDGTRGQALPYIDNRAVQHRLDETVGPSNWSNRYEEVIAGDRLIAVRGVLGIRVGSGWVEKEDGAPLDQTDTSARGVDLTVKGVYSDAMKRAAVQWGIGRYLYEFQAPWVNLNERGGLAEVPRLPPAMLPAGEPVARAAAPAAAPAAAAPVAAPAPVVDKPVESPVAQPAAPVAQTAAPAPAPAVDKPAPAPAPVSKAAEVLQPPTENAGKADALVDAHMANAQKAPVAAPAPVAPAAAPAAASADDSADADLPAGLTDKQKALVDDLLAKIQKLPPKMIRAYITGPKGQENLTQESRDYLLKKVAAKEAQADQA